MFLPVKKGTKMKDALVVESARDGDLGYTGSWSAIQEADEGAAELFLGLV